MLSKIKTVLLTALMISVAAAIVSSCGVRLEQSYYDEASKTDILPTSNKILCTNTDGERVVGWLIARQNSIFFVLELQYNRSNHQRFNMPQGDYLSIQFSDGASYKLMNGSPIISRLGVVMGDRDQIADATIPLSDSDMKALLSKTIVALYVETSTRNSQFIIKPNKDVAVKKMIRIMRPDL